MNNTLDMIIIVDQNRKVRFATPLFLEMFGLDSEGLPKIDIFDRVHPDDREWLMERHKRVINTQQQ
jgi:two-component system sensor histidine kinase ComP